MRMLALRPGLSAIEPGDAIWAARWAARLLHRLFGMRDTCLLRSLVAGSLVADRPRVAVAVGVRTDPSAGTLLRAHAWLTIEDEAVAMAAEADKDPFESVLTLPMERLA